MGAWYQEKDFGLVFPNDWEVNVCKIKDKKEIDQSEIKAALNNPEGINSLSSLAKHKKTISIAVEDITRPSYVGDILIFIISELESVGIKQENIKLVISNGAHRPLQRSDLTKKIGHHIVENYLIVNHNPYDGLADTGISMGKIPVKINKYFFDADFKIAVGSILPHAFAGFSGGAKLVIPGLACIDTLTRIHKMVLMGFTGEVGSVDNNLFRTEIETVVSKIGLNFFVGYVPGSKRGISGIFAGDMIAAHRSGVSFAKKMFLTDVPDEIDIAILNAYPKDTELLQADTVFSVIKKSIHKMNSKGVVVLTSECSEGFGYHSLFGPGMRLYRQPCEKRFLAGRKLILFSPNINKYEFLSNLWEGYSIFNNWKEVMSELQTNFQRSCKVAVFPTASLQLAKE